MKAIIKRIFYYFYSFICKHHWKPKGFNSAENPYFISNERRCSKCKKTEYLFIIK